MHSALWGKWNACISNAPHHVTPKEKLFHIKPQTQSRHETQDRKQSRNIEAPVSKLNPDELTKSMEQSPSQKLIVTQLIKKFPALYGTRRIITVFTTARHWSKSWARCIQYTTSHPISPRCILILYSRLNLVFRWSLPFRFSDQNLASISHRSSACYMSRQIHSPWLDHPKNT
jgi:hypothetical protein